MAAGGVDSDPVGVVEVEEVVEVAEVEEGDFCSISKRAEARSFSTSAFLRFLKSS